MACSCIRIELAGLVIALIDIAINSTGIFLSSAVLVYQACSRINCRIPVTEAIAKEVHKQYSYKHLPDGERELSETSEYWQLLIFITLCFAQIIVNVLLMIGVRKENIEKVKLWLVFKAGVVIVGIFLILTQDSIGQGVYRQISEILYVFLTLFFMCIVFILYDTMHRRRQRYRRSSARLIES